MTTTWADIQRLAADLQRVQLAEGAKKLSDRNCVEVVSMLMNSKAIDIVFTSDGHAYITRKHLLTEIKNECIGQGGRVSLSDLAHTLNVDYEHIENTVATILKQSTSFILCNAELIAREYVDSLCKQLNERLAETGMLSVSQLAKTWDLPSEILNTLVLPEVGGKVDAQRDGDSLYTLVYLGAQRNLINAILNSLTKVTPVAKLSAYLNLSPSLFWSLFDELQTAGEIPGTVVGSRSSNLAYYVPNLHGMLVRSFVLKSFEQHKMIETSVLKKLFVTDVSAYLKELLPKSEFASLIFFPSAVITKPLWNEIELAIKTEVEKEHFSDISTHMPAALSSDKDVDKAITMCIKSSKEWMSAPGQSFVYTSQLLSNAMQAVDGLINDRAEKEAANWGKQPKTVRKEDKPEEDDWATGKGKKGKGKGHKGAKQTPKEESAQASLTMSSEDISIELERVSTVPVELVTEVTEQIRVNVDAALRGRVESLVHSVHTASAHDHKRSYVQLKDKMNALYDNICLFDQATNSFDDAVADDLRSYLMRTLCTDAANVVLSFMSATENTNTLSPKIRDETISSLSNAESRQAITSLFAAITNHDMFAFHDAVAHVSSPAVCSLNLKMPDKKQRAELVQAYGAELKRQLKECEDAASGLLIALLLILATRYSIAVHASGKFVSHLIAKVEKVAELSVDKNDLLTTTQRLVIASMKNKNDGEFHEKLTEKLNQLKAFLLGDSVEQSHKQTIGDEGETIELKSSLSL